MHLHLLVAYQRIMHHQLVTFKRCSICFAEKYDLLITFRSSKPRFPLNEGPLFGAFNHKPFP